MIKIWIIIDYKLKNFTSKKYFLLYKKNIRSTLTTNKKLETSDSTII